MSATRVVCLLVASAVGACACSAVALAAMPRLTATPVVTFDRTHPGHGVSVYVRLDRAAPRARANGTGAPLVRISIANVGRPNALKTAATVGRPARSCYSARVFQEEGAPAQPRTGMRVEVVIDIGPRSAPTRRIITVRLQGLNREVRHATDNPVLQELGCVKGPST